MKKNTEPIQTDTFYHIYNRGVNSEVIFKQERNYLFFLKQYAKYIEPVAETYAYCLMSNHFHILLRTKSVEEIQNQFPKPDVSEVKPATFHISNQFAKLFNSYSQAINKAVGRTVTLFEEPYRRIEVKSDAYFSQLIAYIHQNPQLHGFVNDFRDYPHSSYHGLLETKTSKLKREEVLEWFGNAKLYVDFHELEMKEEFKKRVNLEF